MKNFVEKTKVNLKETGTGFWHLGHPRKFVKETQAIDSVGGLCARSLQEKKALSGDELVKGLILTRFCLVSDFNDDVDG